MDTINNFEVTDFQTPCFIFHEKEFERSVVGFRQALEEAMGNGIVGYSVKTNSLPYMLSMAKLLNCYAEVVSGDEYELARTCGFSIDHIIYNGPMKSKSTFLEAIAGGAIVNIETKREIEWLKELPQHRVHDVGIRLSVNVSTIFPVDAMSDDDYSRFGFCDETGEFAHAVELIASIPQVRLAGLHIHRTTHSRLVDFYRQLVQYAARVAKKYDLHLNYLDVGGGYFGIFANKPTYQDYCKALAQACQDNGLEKVTLIVEPGNAIHASCFSFLSSVIDVKEAGECRFVVTTNGSRNDIDPFFRKSNYLLKVFSSQKNNRLVPCQVIAGCTCLENDRLTELHNQPLLAVGDRLLYNNVGAYTMCLSPMFIRYLPVVYALNGTTKKVVRQAYTSTEYLMKNKLY